MASNMAVEPSNAAPTIIPGGKFQGALFAALDWDELVALRRDQHVPRTMVEAEIRRRLRLKLRAPQVQRVALKY